ncbi:MAG: hypothetical protein ACE5HV_07965 [Acidobacteriota bacterium]
MLRVLANAVEPMGRTRAARRALLNASGARRILDQLAEAGLVEIVGSGRNQAVRLRDRHPLSEPLRLLFRAEREIFERTVESARRAFAQATLAATAIWIESPSARSPGTVDLGVLAHPTALENAMSAVQSHFEAVEEETAMHFVVHGYSDADRVVIGDQRQRLEEVTLLYGWIHPRWRAEEDGPIVSHRMLDQHARRLAEAIAEALPNDPSLIERTKEWIDRRLESVNAQDAHELGEWRRILSQLSIRQIQALLTEDSERADRLRQSLPFVEALSRSELAQLVREMKA